MTDDILPPGGSAQGERTIETETLIAPDRVERLAAYVRARPALVHVLERARKKFEGLDGPRGELELPERAMRDAVQGLGAPLHGRPPQKVRLEALDDAWRASAFACTLRDALDVLEGGIVVTKRERERWLARAADFYERALEEAAAQLGPNGVPAWTRWRSADPDGVRALAVDAMTDAPPEALRGGELRPGALTERAAFRAHVTVLEALAIVLATNSGQDTSSTVLLPVLASRVSGDPHSLDTNRPAGRLFLQVLATLAPDVGGTNTDAARGGAEHRAALYAAFGIAVDAISSFVAAWHLESESPVVTAARVNRVPVILPLAALNTVSDLRATRQQVWVVENPAVFQMLCEAARSWPIAQQPTLLCGSGFLSLAAQRVLDGLVHNGAAVHYSGDWDANGIMIARTVWRRWPESTWLWRMRHPDAARQPASEEALKGALGGLQRADAAWFSWAESTVRTSEVMYEEMRVAHLLADLADACGAAEPLRNR